MTRRRVLIVDDNFELAENLAEILEEEGFAVDAFDGALPALEHARHAAFDVALLDVKMPGIDGVDLHKALSRLHPHASYVLMTAFSSDARVREALDSGVSCVLPKPVPVDQLVDALGAPRSGAGHLLLVEDDPDLLESLAEVLCQRGYLVHRASTIREALEGLERVPVDAAVVDVNLPDGLGTQLARDMEARQVRVVLVTGLDAADLRQHLDATESLDAPVLSKPFRLEQLLALLAGHRDASTGP